MSDTRHLMVADEECGTYHETGRSSPWKRWVYGISAALAVAAVATLVIFKSGSPGVASGQMRPQELFAKDLVKACPAGHFHQCPSEWKASGNAGGYHCLHKLARQTSQKAYESSGGACRPAKEGPFPFDDCQDQCGIGATVQYEPHHVVHVHHYGHHAHHGHWSHYGSHWGTSHYSKDYHGDYVPEYTGSHWGTSHYSKDYHGDYVPEYTGSHWATSHYSKDYHGDYVPEYTEGDDAPVLAGDEQYANWKDSVSGDDAPVLAGDEQYANWKDQVQYIPDSVDYPTTDSHTVVHHHYVAPLHSAHYYGGHSYQGDGSYYGDLGVSHGYSYTSGDVVPGYDSSYGSYSHGYHGGSYGSHHFSSYGHGSGYYHHGHHSYHSYHAKDENGIHSCGAGHAHQCPADWKGEGNAGGYHCLHQLARQTSHKAYLKSGGACRPADHGPFPESDCQVQCRIGGHARVLVDAKKEASQIHQSSKVKMTPSKKGLKTKK